MSELSRWKEELERILSSMQERAPNDLFRDIYALADAMGHDVGEALLKTHPELFAYRPAVSRAYHEFTGKHDIAEASRLMALDLPARVAYTDVASERSVKYYGNRNEIFDHIDLRNRRRIVMVGCGRNPFTIFHFHDRTTFNEIVGVDANPEAVEMANKLAARLGYERVQIDLGRGQEYDYDQAGVVFVTSSVSPKDAIVSRIADTASENVQIVLWEPFSLARLWSESAVAALDKRLEVVHRDHVPKGLTFPVYVRRRNSSAFRRLGGLCHAEL